MPNFGSEYMQAEVRKKDRQKSSKTYTLFEKTQE